MDNVIEVAAELVMPLMLLTFLASIVMRLLVWYTTRAELLFTQEFEKRVHRYFAAPGVKLSSFHRTVRALLEKTYFESFELRNKYKRRNLDHITSVADRLFLVQDGAVRIVQDTLKQTKYLSKDGYPPKMLDITRGVFDNNPIFNRVLGIFPGGLVNELLNIMPGLFIIGGIFGTFLGIAKGLPELGNMDLGNLDATKHIMDGFLVKIAQSMIKSIIGIGLSVAMSLINTVLSPEGVYYNLVNRFSGSLDQLWNETKDNVVDPAEAPFDPHGALKTKNEVTDHRKAA
jgi:hypothetical protein